MAKNKKMKLEVTTFSWKPEGALTWILKTPREEFERKVKLMPICVLLEEYGYLREAQGCLMHDLGGATRRDYFNDPRSKELRERVYLIEARIQNRFYDCLDTIERMDYWQSISEIEKEQK